MFFESDLKISFTEELPELIDHMLRRYKTVVSSTTMALLEFSRNQAVMLKHETQTL